MTRLGMVIDLAKCNGCGACAFACKAENNTRDRADGQSYNWADFLMQTEGTFPNTKHSVIPVLCNHCTDAPCVAKCPGNPKKAGPGKPYKALYKTPEGITLHDPELCVGCRKCQTNCPYSHEELDAIMARFPFAPFSSIEIIPLADLDQSIANSRALVQEMMASMTKG